MADKSNTPRTDAAVRDFSYRDESGQLISLHAVDLDFTRQLERELASYQQAMPEEPAIFREFANYDVADIKMLWDHIDSLARAYAALKVERDELKAKLAACEVERDCARGNNVLFNEQNLRLTDRIIALEAKLAASEKDAKRWREYKKENKHG